MSKTKAIQITIPRPCSQNWDDMTPGSNGRHCAHCHETVIDFTTYSDAALYNFFTKNKEHVCGRFLFTQLKHPINIPYQPHSRLYRLTIALGLTLIFTQTPNLLAQNQPPKTQQDSLLKQKETIASDTLGGIRGTILDEKKEPLPSAVIQVYQNNILMGGIVSDYNGNYSIGSLMPGKYNIRALYVGYKDVIKKDIVINNSFKEIIFNMSIDKTNFLTGEISIVQYTIPLIDMDNPTKRIYEREEIDHITGK